MTDINQLFNINHSSLWNQFESGQLELMLNQESKDYMKLVRLTSINPAHYLPKGSSIMPLSGKVKALNSTFYKETAIIHPYQFSSTPDQTPKQPYKMVKYEEDSLIIVFGGNVQNALDYLEFEKEIRENKKIYSLCEGVEIVGLKSDENNDPMHRGSVHEQDEIMIQLSAGDGTTIKRGDEEIPYHRTIRYISRGTPHRLINSKSRKPEELPYTYFLKLTPQN